MTVKEMAKMIIEGKKKLYFVDIGALSVRALHHVGIIVDGMYQCLDDDGKTYVIYDWCDRIFETQIEAHKNLISFLENILAAKKDALKLIT